MFPRTIEMHHMCSARGIYVPSKVRIHQANPSLVPAGAACNSLSALGWAIFSTASSSLKIHFICHDQVALSHSVFIHGYEFRGSNTDIDIPPRLECGQSRVGFWGDYGKLSSFGNCPLAQTV
jgi:hypothetical protein